MKVTLLTVVALLTISICSAADPECKYRKIRKLSLHWANPTDCTRYYRCTNKSVKREVVCAEGKVYNARIGKCSSNRKGLCKLTLAAPLAGVVSPCTDEVSGVYLPQSGYCRNFYICNNNQAYPQVCDAGSRFNATTANCIPDPESECWQNKCIYEADGTYLPDASSCASFYVCSGGEATLQDCSSGSYFNSSSSACEPDPNGEHCWENLCVGKKNGDFVKDVNDCHSYYVCSASKPVKQECPEGSYFDWSVDVCIPGECPSSETTTESPTTETTISSTECTEESTKSSSTEAATSTTECPQVTRTTTACLEVSTTTTACPEVTTTTTECNEVTTATTPCPEVTTTTTECPQVTDTSRTCPGGYEEGEFLPYPDSCDKYYVCFDGKLQERECGVGNRFDSIVKACEPDTEHICWPANCTGKPDGQRSRRSLGKDDAYEESELRSDSEVVVFNENLEKSDESFVINNSEISASEKNTANPDKKSENRLLNNLKCLGLYAEGEVVRHPKDCRQYLVCANGEMIPKDCGFGNFFEPGTLTCNIDSEKTCISNFDLDSKNVIVDSKAVSNDDTCTCPGGYKEGQLLPFPNYPENCDKYYICTNGKLQESDCGHGNRFDNSTGTCVPDTDHVCWAAETNCTCPGGYKEGQLLPYPGNCDKYYVCSGGRLQQRECGISNRFDSSLGVCVPDTDNTCWPNVCKDKPDGTAIEDSTNCTSFYLCESGKGKIYECPPEKWFNPQHLICVPDYNATCINPCKDTTGITFQPNPDCAKYFLCNDGQPYVETCPDGGFDITLGKCHKDAVCEATLCVDKDDGTTFPVVGNDTKFYVCLGGVAQINECSPGTVFQASVGVCLEQPSSDCDQSKCSSASSEYDAFAPLSDTDDTAFCLCRDGAAYLYHCSDTYTFRADLGICYSNAPCDPELCDVYPENTRSPNRNDTHSFCLCVSKHQVIVDCPNNQTYNPVSQLCQTNDEKCSSTFCLTAAEYTVFPALDNNTDGFCICLASGAEYKPCEGGTKFNVDKGVCLPTNLEGCSDSLCLNNVGLIFGATGDPNSFCYCAQDGVAVKKSCPNSETFNDTLLICQALGCDGQVCLTNPSAPFPALNEPYSFCVCASTDPSSVTKHKCEIGTRFNPYLLICIEDPCNSSVCADASKDGLAYPANNYPQGFCICVNGVAELHPCPSGAVFDPTTAVCVSSTNLECNISKCANATPENIYAVAANNDSHGFCYCFSATEVEFFYCPDDALFDPARGICDVNELVTPTPAPESNCTCPGGYKEGQILPNPTNCRLYFVCTSGRLEERDCGAGNIFDQVSLTCQPAGKKRAHTIGHLMRSEAVPQDDKFCIDNEKQSVPSNCSQYEICIDGAWIRLSCTSERYYNPEQRKCIEPRDDTVCAFARVKNLPVCSIKMEQSTVAAKDLNCNHYYRCSHGKWRLKTCPKHYFYSKRLKTCILSPYDDPCMARNVTGIDNEVEAHLNKGSSKCRHMEVRRYEQNCAMYLMCMEGKWWYQYCPLGMYYNHTYNYCMPNIEGKCVTSFDASIQQKDSMQPCELKDALRPLALSCDRYFQCRAGYWELMACAPHQYFNATERACLPDIEGICAQLDTAQCHEGEKREFPLNCTAYEICLRGAWVRTSCKHSWVFDNTLRMCVPNDGSCAENGLRKVCGVGEIKAHPLPENCAQFYYCLKDSWYGGACLKGQTFAKLSGECVPHDVNDKCKPLFVEVNVNTITSGYLSDQKQIGSNKSGLCIGRADGSAVPHPDSCLHFFICLSEVATNEQKCVRGSFFDARLGYCRPNDGGCVIPLSGVCASITDGGYVADPEDCQAYYHCSTLNGTELLRCADGEYYHNATRQCQIDRGECRFRPEEHRKCASADHGKRLPHERYCNLYYACVRGLAILAACPAEQQFSTALESCVLDEMYQCENGPLEEVAKNAASVYICVNLTNGIHLPDTTDCSKYYICLDGLPLRKNCPAGTFFDLKQELCVPDDGSCPYVENNQSNHQPEPPQPGDCEGKHGSIISDPANCNEFYVCINGKLRHERCYTNFYFNASLNQCQPYEHDIENTTNAEAASSNASQVKVMPKELHCKDKPTNYTQLCTQIPQGTSIAEQGDCRRYINCNDAGEPVSQRCRNGESYDSLLGFCRQNDGTCLLENGQRVGECNGRHGQLVRDTDSCRGYFVCINGQKIAKECEEKKYFDKTLFACVEDVNNQCSTVADQSIDSQVMSCSGLSDSILYPYTADSCRSYFQCVNGKPTVHECAGGLYFNASIARCVKDITECAMPTVTAKRAPEVVSFKENICEKAIPGQRYANIGDHCRSFYVCLEDGTVAYTTCPLDELYSSVSGACEIARDVICKI